MADALHFYSGLLPERNRTRSAIHFGAFGGLLSGRGHASQRGGSARIRAIGNRVRPVVDRPWVPARSSGEALAGRRNACRVSAAAQGLFGRGLGGGFADGSAPHLGLRSESAMPSATLARGGVGEVTRRGQHAGTRSCAERRSAPGLDRLRVSTRERGRSAGDRRTIPGGASRLSLA